MCFDSLVLLVFFSPGTISMNEIELLAVTPGTNGEEISSNVHGLFLKPKMTSCNWLCLNCSVGENVIQED